MSLLEVDRTMQIGGLYIDFCGGIGSRFELGISVANFAGTSWGRHVSVRLGWWAITIGVSD